MAHSANARSGKLLINNKELTTPAVVFTGVNTTMLTNQELQSLGTVAIKQSALRYWLNGSDVFGDLHDRLNWAGWIIGDPGCEQAYRWAKPRGRKKDGVSFHEPESGQQKLYKPEDARGWQDKLGCDLQTGFWRWEDYYSPVDDLQASAKHTASWTTEKGDNTLLPIVGGGLKRVRQASAETAIKQSPLGYAIAGVDTEVKLAEQVRLVKEVVGMLPEDGLRYLPTSGSIEHVLMAMINGVDLVDSDCADEAAQHGVAFDGTKRIHLAKEHFLE
ncbi:MAG: tRNA-guanine transglycosylase, partial [Corynebacterium sp.]|nr:tRNA-guanine transglycosylase [Corynebacterium sp.]